MPEPSVSLRSALKDYSGSVQLVGMELEGCAPQNLLVAFPPETGLPPILDEAFDHPTYLYHDYAIYRRDLRPGATERAQFSDSPRLGPRGRHDLVVLFLPKSKELIEHAVSTVALVLEDGGTLLLVGPRKSGIHAAKPLASRYVGPVLRSRAARHAVTLTICRTVADPPAFDGQKEFEVEAWGRRLMVISLPGVFSHGRLDAGTRYLLAQLELPDWFSALDFGCGAGVLGTALRLARPRTRVDLVDSNVMALEATRRTLRANRLLEHGVWASDGFSDVAGEYDLILSNPPFHQGLATDFSATNDLIRSAARHLTIAGRLILVTNTFIDYLSHLRAAFRHVNVVSQSPRYRITEARGLR